MDSIKHLVFLSIAGCLALTSGCGPGKNDRSDGVKMEPRCSEEFVAAYRKVDRLNYGTMSIGLGMHPAVESLKNACEELERGFPLVSCYAEYDAKYDLKWISTSNFSLLCDQARKAPVLKPGEGPLGSKPPYVGFFGQCMDVVINDSRDLTNKINLVKNSIEQTPPPDFSEVDKACTEFETKYDGVYCLDAYKSPIADARNLCKSLKADKISIEEKRPINEVRLPVVLALINSKDFNAVLDADAESTYFQDGIVKTKGELDPAKVACTLKNETGSEKRHVSYNPVYSVRAATSFMRGSISIQHVFLNTVRALIPTSRDIVLECVTPTASSLTVKDLRSTFGDSMRILVGIEPENVVTTRY